MASNPIMVTLSERVVTKVATNVTTGIIHQKKQSMIYLQTFRLTGLAAPDEATMIAEGCPMFRDQTYEPISSSAGIDVYLYCYNRNANSTDTGLVRVDI